MITRVKLFPIVVSFCDSANLFNPPHFHALNVMSHFSHPDRNAFGDYMPVFSFHHLHIIIW